MATFTVIRFAKGGAVVEFGVQGGWSGIEAVTRTEVEAHQATAKRASTIEKVRTLEFRDGQAIAQVTITTRNQAGAGVAVTVIQAEQPSEAINHRHIMGGGLLTCQECESQTFYDNGRSRFSFNFVCTECRKEVHPMTETGAST